MLILMYFDRTPLGHATKANFKTFRTVDLVICSISNFYKRVWDNLLHDILRIISQEKCSQVRFH